jgi:cob(I)alamin adenosyltransferase
MIPSITTRRGDKGYTSLLGGLQVPKYDIRPSTYGIIDELGSILGIVRSHSTNQRICEIILQIQKDLFEVNAELASSLNEREKRIADRHIAQLEAWEEEAGNNIEMPKTFIISGESQIGAYIDLARAVSRRCERQIVQMLHLGYLFNDKIVVYLNRLSDLLWLLARWEEQHLSK